MKYLKKYAEINGYQGIYLTEVLKTLEDQGFLIVKDNPEDEDEEGWITYGIVK